MGSGVPAKACKRCRNCAYPTFLLVCLSFSSKADRKLAVAAAAAAAAVAMAGLSHSNGVLAAAPSVDFEAVEKVNAGAVHTRAMKELNLEGTAQLGNKALANTCVWS